MVFPMVFPMVWGTPPAQESPSHHTVIPRSNSYGIHSTLLARSNAFGYPEKWWNLTYVGSNLLQFFTRGFVKKDIYIYIMRYLIPQISWDIYIYIWHMTYDILNQYLIFHGYFLMGCNRIQSVASVWWGNPWGFNHHFFRVLFFATFSTGVGKYQPCNTHILTLQYPYINLVIPIY